MSSREESSKKEKKDTIESFKGTDRPKYHSTCFKCGKKGHKAFDCKNYRPYRRDDQYKNYNNNHSNNNWREGPKRAAAAITAEVKQWDKETASDITTSHGNISVNKDSDLMKHVNNNNEIALACGRMIPVVRVACVKSDNVKPNILNSMMPVVDGKINGMACLLYTSPSPRDS